MKVLVVGGAGYIGSHMVKMLGENDCQVTSLDDLSSGHRDAVLYGDFVQGDMGDNAVKGSPIELYDLIFPHSKWNIDDLLWTEDFIESMNNPEPTTRHDHYEQAVRQFAKISLEIPIRV